jgi:hypothetical protein
MAVRTGPPPTPSFRATIAILGINPYVRVPTAQLKALFKAAGRDKGPLPIKVSLDGAAFQQTLVKYQGAWRLYLNTPMRQSIGKDVGDRVNVLVELDPNPRVEPMSPLLERALAGHRDARAAFEALSPSRKKEILRYLNALKTQASLERKIETVVRQLRGMPAPRRRHGASPKNAKASSR